MTRKEIMRSLKNLSEGGAEPYKDIYDSLLRLRRTDRDGFDGLMNHLSQVAGSSDELQEYLVCEM